MYIHIYINFIFLGKCLNRNKKTLLQQFLVIIIINYINNFRWSVDGEYILISGIFDKVKNTLKIPKFGGEIEKMPYHITSSPDGKRGLHYWAVSKIIPITNLDNGKIIDSVKISFDYTFLLDVKWSTKDDFLLFTTQKEGDFILSAFLTSTMGIAYKLKLEK